MNEANIEMHLNKLYTKLDKIITLLEEQKPKSSKELLLEQMAVTYHTDVTGIAEKKNLPTPWNNIYAEVKPDDILLEHKTYNDMLYSG